MAEELAQHRGAFIFEQAADYLDAMIEPPIAPDVVYRAERAGFRVTRAVLDCRDPRVNYRTDAHHARL